MERLNGINLVSVLVDRSEEHDFSGRIINQYDDKELIFTSSMGMIRELEELYNEWGFPEESEKTRSFTMRRINAEDTVRENETEKRLVNFARDIESRDITSERGDLATFLILTEMRQHSTWQGKALHAEADEKKNFQSVLELLFFIDDVLNDK
ncbi:hypothetical protein [Oribacterium sp. WCC10]|uniref:hypothetical protein n=1 Tax=Oribacterium sp. WCC10 TaxID=1855343 RepID=UPI0008E439ED|nr:hypothetical protein [Oribacterium sp. WCC10]SFG18656.1 hypothetical protein SAMN05216356_10318 [Oribacterium sp. WCC10]